MRTPPANPDSLAPSHLGCSGVPTRLTHHSKQLSPQTLSSGGTQHLYSQEELGAGILFKSKVNYFSNFMPHALCISRYRWQ